PSGRVRGPDAGEGGGRGRAALGLLRRHERAPRPWARVPRAPHRGGPRQAAAPGARATRPGVLGRRGPVVLRRGRGGACPRGGPARAHRGLRRPPRAGGAPVSATLAELCRRTRGELAAFGA